MPAPTTTAVKGGPPLSVASSQVLQTYRPTASSEKAVCCTSTCGKPGNSCGSGMSVLGEINDNRVECEHLRAGVEGRAPSPRKVGRGRYSSRWTIPWRLERSRRYGVVRQIGVIR